MTLIRFERKKLEMIATIVTLYMFPKLFGTSCTKDLVSDEALFCFTIPHESVLYRHWNLAETGFEAELRAVMTGQLLHIKEGSLIGLLGFMAVFWISGLTSEHQT